MLAGTGGGVNLEFAQEMDGVPPRWAGPVISDAVAAGSAGRSRGPARAGGPSASRVELDRGIRALAVLTQREPGKRAVPVVDAVVVHSGLPGMAGRTLIEHGPDFSERGLPRRS